MMKTALATLTLLTLALPTWAGSLDAPAAPAAGSGMPSTADIYNRLDTGAAVIVPGSFQEPAAGPTAGTGRTLADIAAKLPAPDNTHGAAAGDVANGKTFWGLRTDGTWGVTSGTQAAPASGANVTGANGQLTFAIPDGLYSGGKTATAADGNLQPGNIKSGVSIFGVSGTAAQASGNAAAPEVLTGKTFSNSSATGLTGSMADNGTVSITPGTAAQTIPAGYHNGAGSVAGDANLVSGNIRSGASIFGVNGSATVVDTAEAAAAATAADIRLGKKAYVNGVLVTGTYCPNGWSGTSCDIIAKPSPSGTPNYASTQWKCVYDTATGLTWEGKTVDGGLHDKNNTYTWYDSTDAANPGTANGGRCNGSGCDTEKFVAAVNAEQLCSYTNWRMPSKSELEGLVASGSSPTIDTAYFPNTVANQFWSGSSFAPDPFYAWNVYFGDGRTSAVGKPFSGYVRLVRSGP